MAPARARWCRWRCCITLVLLFKAFDSLSLAVLTLLNVPFALVGGVFGLWRSRACRSRSPRRSASSRSSARRRSTACWSSRPSPSGARRGEPLDEAIVPGLPRAAAPGADDRRAGGARPGARGALATAWARETQRPLAVVIVGGTLSACALTLLVLPVMYRVWERLVERSRPTPSRSTAEPVVGPI